MSVPKEMILKQIEFGAMQNFSYLVGCAETKEVAVVDPGWDAELLSNSAEKDGLKISCIFITHGHFDHTNVLGDLLSRHDVPVYVSKYEAGFLRNAPKNIEKTDDCQKIKIGNVDFKCIWTPGHSPGGQCLYCQGLLITGDTLFINGCGRCDLGGGDPEAMYDTLYNKIMKLPDSTVIYPGHAYGPKSFDTLANQKKTNPYLRCQSREEFLSRRMR